MKTFSVHCREDVIASPTGLADGALFVKEGFSWPAFLFSPVWSLLKGLWLIAAIHSGFYVVIGLLLAVGIVSEDLFWLLLLAFNLLLGFEGNDLYRRKLARRALRERGVVVADNLQMAEHRFFVKLEQSGDLSVHA